MITVTIPSEPDVEMAVEPNIQPVEKAVIITSIQGWF